MTMFKSTTNFDKLLDKSTSHLLLEPDWTSILQICDLIRQNDIQSKYVINAIKKKMYASNPHVSLFALQVLESCVKNCGQSLHTEVASKAFMEEFRELVKLTSNDKVKEKILELIQTWAYAFRNEPNFRAVQDTLNLMKIEGYKFPVQKESDAMFLADQAPEWADGECCHRCRVAFSAFQRKHHCRCCGQIFCSKCTPKMSAIPKYGIEKEVRVCEDCFDKLTKPTAVKTGTSSEQSSPFKTTTTTSSAPAVASAPSKTEQDLQEEEELQLALALSQSEAESKEQKKLYTAPAKSILATGQQSNNNIKKVEQFVSADDPEMEKYLNRDNWIQKAKITRDENTPSPTPSAPQPQQTTKLNDTTVVAKTPEKVVNGDRDDLESFLTSLRSAVEIFVNRMDSNQIRGRPISNDTAVQSLFLSITNMHSQHLKYIQEQDDSRLYYESLQDKLSQIRDARAALDSLREEHQEKLRHEAEEADRLRQQQMAQKLEIMRKKKQEYLQYQRQMALQRIQEQDMELKLRQEQQKYLWHQQQQQQMGQPQPQQAAQQQGYQQPQGYQQQNYGPAPHPSTSPGHMPQYNQPPPAPVIPYNQQPPPQQYQQQYQPQNIPVAPPPPYQQQVAAEYPQQPYNMQTMAANLPNIRQVAPQQPSGQPPPPTGLQQQSHQATHYVEAQQPVVQQAPPAAPIQQPPTPVEAPLISFD